MKEIIKLLIALMSFIPLGKIVAKQNTPNINDAIDKNKYPLLI